MQLQATIWTLLPPVIAIALALITKEVYSSLLIGILSGALLYTSFSPIAAIETTFGIMGEKIGGNANILIFLVLLGILVSLVTKSGASRAYGEWASRRITSRRGALLATSALGALIFVDDYFNCLTVGTVMRPVTDKYKVSRAKLAYIIDATAAPVCIIAPISSWAAAVGSSMPEGANIDGFTLFLRTIPYNFYALLTLAFIIWLMAWDKDIFAMKKYQDALGGKSDSINTENYVVGGAGQVKDLVVPILVLILSCVASMMYTGGLLEGASLVDAFANCDSSASLVLGSFITLVFTFIMYVPRGILNFGQFCESFTEGFKAMVPAIMILCLAWTLSGVCSADYLNIGGYVDSIVRGNATIIMLMPAIFFAIALGLAFATGTSWGTFGILIPIAVIVFQNQMSELLVVTVAACLAGAVCGDHISPISDTTILASAGAQCNHIDHVSTQIPYALTVAAICFISYLVAGFVGIGWAGLATGIVLLAIFAGTMMARSKKDA